MLQVSNETTSAFVAHLPCDNCESSDANALYDDGHTHCFSCRTHVQSEGSTIERKPYEPTPLIDEGNLGGWQERGLSFSTCERWAILRGQVPYSEFKQFQDEGIGTDRGVTRIFNYRDSQRTYK